MGALEILFIIIIIILLFLFFREDRQDSNEFHKASGQRAHGRPWRVPPDGECRHWLTRAWAEV